MIEGSRFVSLNNGSGSSTVLSTKFANIFTTICTRERKEYEKVQRLSCVHSHEFFDVTFCPRQAYFFVVILSKWTLGQAGTLTDFCHHCVLVPRTYTSVADSWHFGTDLNPDPWIRDFDKWILFSSLTSKTPTKYFCLIPTLQKVIRSHKAVGIKVFLNIFA